MSKMIKWIIGAVVCLLLAIPIGTYIYINFVEEDAPERLTLDSQTTSTIIPTTTAAAGAGTSSTAGSPVALKDVTGAWKATSSSQVGYRVKEVLFGQNTEAVGRTSNVSGTLTIDGMTVKDVDLSVDMTSVKSDQSRRDDQFDGRIMSTDQFPTATFKLTDPVKLKNVPTATPETVKAVGDLTLRGVTKSVTVDLKVQQSGTSVKVNGTIPVIFADWNIPNPSFSGITTEDHGELELLVDFQR